MNRFVLLLVSLSSFGCASSRAVGSHVDTLPLQATDGRPHPLLGEGNARLTVIVFSAWHCPCQTAHDPRLSALYERYKPQGVDFFLVDSEVGGSLAADTSKAKERGYAFPVLLDPGGGLARRLHAEYATETFVLNRQATVVYHGGVDSDRTTLHNDAVPLLANALDDLLLGRVPRAPETKALGCALQTW